MVAIPKGSHLLTNPAWPNLREIRTAALQIRHDWDTQKRRARRERAIRSQQLLFQRIVPAGPAQC